MLSIGADTSRMCLPSWTPELQGVVMSSWLWVALQPIPDLMMHGLNMDALHQGMQALCTIQ